MNQLLSVIKIVRIVIEPDVIFNLGTATNQFSYQSIFSTEIYQTTHTDNFFLLVLIPPLDSRTTTQLQEQIEQQFILLGNTATVIVLNSSTFNHWLSIGHSFAQKVFQSGLPIYQEEHFSFAALQVFDTVGLEKINEKIYHNGINQSQEFFTGAELYLIRKQFKLSIFMLHQATEQALSVWVKWGMGYYSCSHNIERLLRYASWVYGGITEIFPQKTIADKRRFKLLQRAYIDSRYRVDFTIDYKDLIILKEKVQDLIAMLNRFYNG